MARCNSAMDVDLLPLVQGAGAVTLAVVAFGFAFTWPSLIGPILSPASERVRLLLFTGLGLLQVVAASLLYVVPGLLLRDEVGLLISVPLAATWLIAAAALAIRGLVLRGAARAVSFSFSLASVCGLAAGIVAALCAQHRIADTITPTGAFLLALTAVAGIVCWSKTEQREGRRA